MLKTKISFIGGGSMAEAMISGMTHSNLLCPSSISCFDKDKNKLAIVCKKYGIKPLYNAQEAFKSDLSILAVKP